MIIRATTSRERRDRRNIGVEEGEKEREEGEKKKKQ